MADTVVSERPLSPSRVPRKNRSEDSEVRSYVTNEGGLPLYTPEEADEIDRQALDAFRRDRKRYRHTRQDDLLDE